jgi:hypothetical protein
VIRLIKPSNKGALRTPARTKKEESGAEGSRAEDGDAREPVQASVESSQSNAAVQKTIGAMPSQ